VLFYLADLAFSDKTAPFLMSFSKDNNGIDGKYNELKCNVNTLIKNIVLMRNAN
jgi:hypothetical protein